MRRSAIRLELLVASAALAVASSALLLALGLPALARGRLSPPFFAALVAADALLVVAVAAAILFRVVARPVDRLVAAAARIDPAREPLPLLGEDGGPALERAATAFERAAAALSEERSRLASKVEELTAANRALAETRESLQRTERLATVGRLASGVAHEVGNPLAAVQGYVALARQRLPPGARELEDFLARIAAEAERIDRTVRDLLDFARPSRASLSSIELAPAVDGALRLARMQARFRAVEVELALPRDLPRVTADEHHLAQVFVNLFLNAGDAMQGRGSLLVRGQADAGGGAVLVSVADRGPGIPACDLPRVFDPFFTTKPPGEGTGLGLAICHRLMESFGGEISASNRDGGGACFTLRFPAA
jgi:two-component system, NtrC family, sensor kinase